MEFMLGFMLRSGAGTVKRRGDRAGRRM